MKKLISILASIFLFACSNPQSISGPQRIQGKPGLNGVDGKDGLDGERGPQGLPGLKGDKGENGLDGPEGIQGPKGEIGKDLNSDGSRLKVKYYIGTDGSKSVIPGIWFDLDKNVDCSFAYGIDNKLRCYPINGISYHVAFVFDCQVPFMVENLVSYNGFVINFIKNVDNLGKELTDFSYKEIYIVSDPIVLITPQPPISFSCDSLDGNHSCSINCSGQFPIIGNTYRGLSKVDDSEFVEINKE